MSEPNKAVQDEELEALRAIFGDDWQDIPPKKTAWGTENESGWWAVKLCALDDERVSVTLKGRMIKTYPVQPPPLKITDAVKLTPTHVRKLTECVQEKAKASVGAPMIYDLTDLVRDWITANHVPLPKPGEPEPTLMEEMAQREEAQRAAEAAQSQADREQRRAQERENDRRLNEMILQDSSRKEERARQAVLDAEAKQREEKLAGLTDGELEMRELVLDAPISVDGYHGQWSSWTLFGGRREPLWTSYTAEPAADNLGFVKASMPTVTVLVVDFSKPWYLSAPAKRRIDAVVAEANCVKEVASPHVAKVYTVQRTKSPRGWDRVIIVVERVPEGGLLSAWLPKSGFSEETAKDYVAQILSGLADLHRAGVHRARTVQGREPKAFQGQLDSDLVLLCPGSDGEVCVKLVGTMFAKKIVELHRSNPFLKKHEEPFPESWLSPEEIESPYQTSPKRDIWHAGLVLLQMLYGKHCLWTYSDLNTLIQHAPGGVSASLMDLLSGLLNPNHKKRLTAEEALSRLRAPDEELTSRPALNRASISLASSAAASASSSFHQEMFGRSPVFGRTPGTYFPQANVSSVRHSRYRTDFEEVEFLGKGGFGEVVKARNKLDGRPYAIKKVKLRPEDNESRVLREVNSLSRVSHQYIVRYYSCWLEEVGPPEQFNAVEGSDPATSTVNSSNVSSSNSSDIFAVNFDDVSVSRRDHSRSASFPRIRFADSDEEEDDEDEDDEEDDDNRRRRSADTEQEDSDDSDGSDDSADSQGTIADPSASAPKSRSKALSIPSRPRPSAASYTDATTEDGTVQRILYIQMEFVEKQTLREAITAGLSEDEAWRLLVQILQALAHMSSLGIVHRDLKPSNILLDANGNVKIADFGLSTTDLGTVEVPSGGANLSGDFGDRTSNIGTGLYIAPEVLVSKSYNEKADMYSLGIILFEMCYAFKTGMERVHTLTALRSPAVTFPEGWPATLKPKQREIVDLLLRHDPTLRPQATQLLNGPLVPTINREEKFYDNVITEITDPRSEKYPTLIDTLFESHAHALNVDNRIDDYTYDNDFDDVHYIWLTVVVGRIAEIFRRHGAVDDYVPLLVPETTLLNAFPERVPVRLLDANGKFVQLPSSNLLAVARSAARREIERIKRYVVARRYTELPVGGQPGTHSELCFDIVSPLRSLVAEAELLEVTDKIINMIQGGRAGTHVEYEIHVSHESVLAILLAAAPVPVRPRLLKAFKGPSSGVAFGSARPSLSSIQGLPAQLVHDLETCTGAGPFEVVRRKLEETFTSSRRKLAGTMDELAKIIDLAKQAGVQRRILFRPTMSKSAEYFRGGFMFECVRRGKQNEVVAFGGRYDSLLEHFKNPATQRQSRKAHGVGMAVAADLLSRQFRKSETARANRRMEKKSELVVPSFGLWSPARCDVYVTSTPQVDVSERLRLAGELWNAEIRADLQYDDGRGLPQIIDECLEQNILFIVIARRQASVKVVRVLQARLSEIEVPSDNLIQWLHDEIAEQRRVDQAYDEGKTPPPREKDEDAKEYARVMDADIQLILPPEPLSSRTTKGKPVRKHRHVTKTLYYQKAEDFANSVQSALPIVGVDMSPELLAKLTLNEGWVSSDDAWRAIIHHQEQLPPNEREYADQVRRAVQDQRKKSRSNMWLFSVREARGFLLQFPR